VVDENPNLNLNEVSHEALPNEEQTIAALGLSFEHHFRIRFK